MSAASKIKPIAFFLPNLHGGGAERVAINLLKGMAEKDVPLDLVLADAEGPYLELVPKSVRVINLGAGRVLKAILPLSRYLRANRPSALLSHLNHANVVALFARNLASTKTRLVVVEHNTLSVGESKFIRGRFVKPFMQWIYPSADAIVGVSKGVSLDLEQQLSLPAGKVITIYNPVVDRELSVKAQTTIDHPWFQRDSPPVFLAVGRLSAQKDFSTLIQAFALSRKQARARLLILGEGELRRELEEAIYTLGITEDVSMPGFVPNTYAYMSQATALILSSRWEGLPTVLIEAMACGCPVISTDCPSGPKEILEDGKYGNLVPIGDPVTLSKFMLQLLTNPPVNRALLIQRSMDFSVDKAVAKYLSVLNY